MFDPAFLHLLFRHFHHYGAFDTLLEQLAARFIDAPDGAGSVVSVGRAAARAVELGPAVCTLRTGVGIAGTELLTEGVVGHAVPYISQFVAFVAHKLVAGIKVAPRGHGHIFSAGAAAGNTLIDARPFRQVEHIMIERYGPSFALTAEHIFCKYLILLFYDLYVLRSQGGRVI